MTRLLVPDDLREKVEGFVKENDLKIEVVDEEPCDLRVEAAGEEHKECRGDTIVAGGWIRCASAWKLGKRHGIPLLQLGALLDLLDVRVRECCLGCF